MDNHNFRCPSCLFMYGVPKYYAVVSSAILSFVVVFTVSLFCPGSLLSSYSFFFILWLLAFVILHNPTLDKPDEIYTYRIINEKSFIDEKDMLEYLNNEGSNGWELISIKSSGERIETYKFMFKKKHYSLSNKPTFKWRGANVEKLRL